MDDNVFVRAEAPLCAADFSFMAEQARVDGLALPLDGAAISDIIAEWRCQV